MGALLPPALLADIPVLSDTSVLNTPLPGSTFLISLWTISSLALCLRLLCLHAALLNVMQLLVRAPWLPTLSAKEYISLLTRSFAHPDSYARVQRQRVVSLCASLVEEILYAHSCLAAMLSCQRGALTSGECAKAWA
jgi:hypothetical protein